MVMWTARHFRVLAEQVRNANMPWSAKKEWSSLLADTFEADNPRFDRFKFLEACGTLAAECPTCGEPNGDHLPGCALQESFLTHPAQPGRLKVVT